MPKRDHPTVASRLSQRRTGIANLAVERAQSAAAEHSRQDGVDPFLVWLSTAAGTEPHDEQTRHAGHCFPTIERNRGTDTMRDWQQDESMVVLRLQEALECSIEREVGSDADSEDERLPCQ